MALDSPEINFLFIFNPFSMGTGWTLYKVRGFFRISYGTGYNDMNFKEDDASDRVL